MGVFSVAALAGFLLFGWIKAIPKLGDDFQKLRLQSVLGVSGLLALFVLALCVIVLTTQWPSYDAFRIVQDLTGRETAQFILGAAFGCILRYWGPQFWSVSMPPEHRYNWVAISLVGLLLLAAAIPYLDRQLGGMTGLKTPFAEFQFASKGKTGSPPLEKDLQIKALTDLRGSLQFVAFSDFFIDMDLLYIKTFPKDESANYRESYKKSRSFAKKILQPLGRCALNAYENYLDIESIRHELQPVAQILYLLIQQGQGSISSEEELGISLLVQINESLDDLNRALGKDRCALVNMESLKDLVVPRTLAKAPPHLPCASLPRRVQP